MHKATYIADAPTTSITPLPPQPLPAPQNRPPYQFLLTPQGIACKFFSISPMIYSHVSAAYDNFENITK